MSRIAVGLSWALGLIGTPSLLVWSLRGPGVNAHAILIVGSLLLIGPLAFLPAAGLGKCRAKWSAAILLTGAPAAFLWQVGLVMNEGFQQFLHADSFEARLPLMLISGPMVVVGGLFSTCSNVDAERPPRWPLGLLVLMIVVPAVTLVCLMGGVD